MDAAPAAIRRLTRLLPLLVLAFYLFTAAPSVLWGDDAFFQRSAFDGTLPRDGGGHWLWFALARAVVRVPLGEVAYRVNALSALAAAATLAGLLWAARLSGLSPAASLIAAGSLAVAHTFWMHAVRAEVYTVFTACLVMEIALLLGWLTRRAFGFLAAALLLFGLTLLGHQMAVLLLPAFGCALWLGRQRLSPRAFALALASFSLGLLPALALIHRQVAQPNPIQSLLIYLTHSGVDFSGALFDFSLAALPRDGALWLGYLVLQFPGLALLLGLYAAATFRAWLRSDPWKVVGVLYATCAAFAFSYRVSDQYAFYLPSFVVFALFIGHGWDLAASRWPLLRRPLVTAACLLLVVITPPLAYLGTVAAFDRLAINPLHVRALPGREPNRFFIWPAKNGYRGAYDYGSGLLASLPPDSLLIADHTPYQTLRYLQTVHALRPDVRLIVVGPADDLMAIVASASPATSVFLADDNPAYYHLGSLAAVTTLRQGYAIKLVPEE